MSIEQKLSAWDGKSAADIRAIYDEYHTRDDFTDRIVELTTKPDCQKGATWLLKAWLETGNTLKQSQVSRIYGLLNKLEHWEAKLHVLQSIPFMTIAEADRDSVYRFLRTTIIDQNKLVRAWSYNGFYELSSQHGEYKEESERYFTMAMRDEAPSVKARIRNIMKKGS